MNIPMNNPAFRTVGESVILLWVFPPPPPTVCCHPTSLSFRGSREPNVGVLRILCALLAPQSRLSVAVPPSLPDSPAAVQPHVPTPQPGSVILVLVGGEVADDGRLPGLQGVCVLVRAVPGAWEDTGAIPSGLCKMLSPHRFSDTSDSTEIHWHAGSGMDKLSFSQRQEIPSLGPCSFQEPDKRSCCC